MKGRNVGREVCWERERFYGVRADHKEMRRVCRDVCVFTTFNGWQSFSYVACRLAVWQRLLYVRDAIEESIIQQLGRTHLLLLLSWLGLHAGTP